MRYPTITESQCLDCGRAKAAGESWVSKVQWVGQGEEVDLGPLRAAAAKIRALMDEADLTVTTRDQVEGQASAILYRALSPGEAAGRRGVDVEVLDDPGFWRYLSLELFWDFITWREWKKPEQFNASKHLVYVNALKSPECVLTRMFLRMSSLGGSTHEALASCLKDASDFWRSHIVRVRTAGAASLVRAMVRSQRDARLVTVDVRELAKRVNRTWSNLVLDLYASDEATQLVRELRSGLGDNSDGGSRRESP